MKSILLFCDRCEKEVKDGFLTKAQIRTELPGGTPVIFDVEANGPPDLCDACFWELLIRAKPILPDTHQSTS